MIMVILALSNTVIAVPTQPTSTPSQFEPTYGNATVDGNSAEWDLDADHFSSLYLAADDSKTVFGETYLRYDMATGTLYVLVINDYPITVDSDSFVKIDGRVAVNYASGNDGSAPDFQYDSETPHYVWEASFLLPPGTYDIQIHNNVFESDKIQTSGTIRTGFPIFVVPEYAFAGLMALGACFAGFAVIKKKNALHF